MGAQLLWAAGKAAELRDGHSCANSKMRQTTPLLALNTTPTSMQGFRPIRSDNAAPLGDNSNELNADTVATCALSIAAAVGEPATETASCMLAAWPTPTCSDEDRPS